MEQVMVTEDRVRELLAKGFEEQRDPMFEGTQLLIPPAGAQVKARQSEGFLMGKVSTRIECPHCGREARHYLKDNSASTPQVLYCDPEDGGCNQHFVVKLGRVTLSYAVQAFMGDHLEVFSY